MRPLPLIKIAGARDAPTTTRWVARGVPVDYTFYVTPRNLVDILAEEACADSFGDMTDFIAFGECDYANGGGARPWLVVRQSDGGVFSADAEGGAVSLLNSSLEAFVRTFYLFDSFLRDGRPAPEDLEDSLRALDPTAYEQSEWRGLAGHVLAD